MIAEGKAMEFYSKAEGPDGRWSESTDGMDRLKAMVRGVVLKAFKKIRPTIKDGKMMLESYGDPPLACKDTAFHGKIADDVKRLLYVTAPQVRVDSTQMWRFISDKNGCIYDTLTGRFIVNEPGIRVRRRLPWAFANDVPKSIDDVWDAPKDVKENLDTILQRIFQFWLATGNPEGRALGEDPIFGVPLQNALREFVMNTPACKVWHLIAPIFAKSAEDQSTDIDRLLWHLTHQSADFLIWAKRTEWRYYKGPGACGKDVLIMLVAAFLGDRSDDGFFTLFPSDTYTRFHSKSSGLDPVLDSAKSARMVVINEIGSHKFWAHDDMKALVECRGSGMVSRDLYKSPARWLPCCGVCAFSNHPLAVSQVQAKDTGALRRTNYVELHAKFPENVEKDVKAQIETLMFNGELFWLAVKFHSFLLQCPEGSRRVHPRPPSVIEDTEKIFSMAGDFDAVGAWIEDNCQPVQRYSDASLATEVQAALASALGVTYNPRGRNHELDDAMEKTLTLEEKRIGTRRIYVYTFPGQNRARAVKMNNPAVAVAEAEAD
jgi:hypothetical protein